VKASASALLLTFVLVLADLAAQGGGTITGRVLVRERANGEHSLLVGVESPDKVDRVQVTLPNRHSFVPGWVPSTWKLTLDGRKVVIVGDPLFGVSLRLDAKPNEDLIRKVQGKEVELEVGTAASPRLTRFKLKVDALPRVQPGDDWARLGALILPPEITPGGPIFVTPAPGFSEGIWEPSKGLGQPNNNDEVAKERIREAARRTEALSRELSTFFRNLPAVPAAPDALPRNSQMMAFQEPPDGFSYFDRYFELLAELEPSWKRVPAAKCDVTIAGGTPLAFAGQDACVAGCFPSDLGGLEDAARLLMLDDQIPLVPQAASPTTIVVRIPADTRPGQRFINWKQGGASTGRLQLVVLQLEGAIDQNQLWRGQSTTMRLRIVGSDQALPLNIINRTPSVIQIEGGERQVISTSGGADNVVTRQVRGIMKGNFTIDYSLDQPPCGGGR